MRTRTLSLVAALALSVTTGFAAVGDVDSNARSLKLNVASTTSTGWTLIGIPGYLKWSQSASVSTNPYAAQSFTGAITLVDRNDTDGDWNTTVEQNTSAAIVQMYAKAGQWEPQLDAMYDDTNATDWNLTVEFVPQLATGQPSSLKYMLVEANESNPGTEPIARIEFDDQYSGERFNLTIGLGGVTTPIADVNNSYIFEDAKTIYVELSSSSGSGSYAESATNNFIQDIDVNGTLTSSGTIHKEDINYTGVDINLTVLTYRNGAWYDWTYQQDGTGSGVPGETGSGMFSIYENVEDPNANVASVAARKIFENNNTQKAAAYWINLETNVTGHQVDFNGTGDWNFLSDGNINYLVSNGTISSSDLEPVLTEVTGSEGWSLVALPDGPIINAQTGLIVDVNNGSVHTLKGLYDEAITFTSVNNAFPIASQINSLIQLADKNGSAHLKMKAYAARLGATDKILLLSDHKFSIAGTGAAGDSLGGVTIGAAGATLKSIYGEQAIAFHLNTNTLTSNSAARIGFLIPNEEQNTSFELDLSGLTGVTPTLIQAAIEGNLTTATALTTSEVNLVSFSLDGTNYNNHVLGIAAPTYRTSNTDRYLRFAINEPTYTKSYRSGGEQNLSVIYVGGDDNRTNFADVNITTNGTIDDAHGTLSAYGNSYGWDIATSYDGNFTYFHASSPYIELVERNAQNAITLEYNTTDQISDLVFASDKIYGTQFVTTSPFYSEYNTTQNVYTDINKTTGFISYVWSLDKLTDSSLEMNSSKYVKEASANSKALVSDLKTSYVWSAATTRNSGILSTLNSAGDGFLLREAWTYKEDTDQRWYKIDLTDDPSTWVTGGNNLFATRIGDGYWIKTLGGTKTLTAPTIENDNTVAVITRFSNELNTSTNYVFVEKYTGDISSTTTSSFVGTTTNYDNIVLDLAIGTEFKSGRYMPTNKQFVFTVNPYSMSFTDEETLSSTTVYVYDGVSNAASADLTLSGTYTKPDAPAVTITNIADMGSDNFANFDDTTLAFEHYVSEDDLNSSTTRTTPATSLLSSIKTVGKIGAMDFNDTLYIDAMQGTTPSPTVRLFKFINRSAISGTTHALYSDMGVLSYLPIFGARWNVADDTNNSVGDLNQTKKLKDSSNAYIVVSGASPNSTTDIDQNVTHVGSILSSNSITSVSTHADRFDQWLNNIDTTYGSQMDTSGSQPAYDSNSISFKAEIASSTVSLAYRPMYSAYTSESGNTAKLLVGSTAIASVAFPKDYNGSHFYVWYAKDSNKSVYWGRFDYNTVDSNTTLSLTAISGSSTACFVSTNGQDGTYTCQ